MALRDLPPFTLVLGRVSIAALALNLLVRVRGYRMPGDLRGWLPYFAMGTLNNLVPFSLIFWGQTQIAGGLAATLNAMTPVFTIILAHLMTADERLSLHRGVGTAVSVAGVAVLIGPSAVDGIGLFSTALAYIICFRILAAAGATKLLLVTFLIPVSAVFLGVVVLGEAFSNTQVIGMAVIGLGLIAMDGRTAGYLSRRNSEFRGARPDMH